MGNAVNSPPTFPDPDVALPGVRFRAATWDRMANIVNRAARDQVGGLPIDQAFDGALTATTGDTEAKITPGGWAVPVISPIHTAVAIYVVAKATGDGGTVFVRSDVADDEVVFDVPGGNVATELGPITLAIEDDGAGGGEVVTLHIEGDEDDVTVTVLEVWARYLHSGLDDDLEGEIVPFGRDDRTTADRPLSAARGRQMVSSLAEALGRPRPMVCWAGIDKVDGDGVPALPAIGVEGMAIYHGDRAAGAYTSRIFADAVGLLGATLAIDGYDDVEIAADAAAAWHELADTHTRLEGAFIARDTLSFRPMAVFDADDGVGPDPARVGVRSFSVWGP